MHTRLDLETAAGPAYVSTGRLPSPAAVRALVEEAYERYKATGDGQNSQVYPALARLPSGLFGICVVGTSGNVYAVGDADYEAGDSTVGRDTSCGHVIRCGCAHHSA